MQGAQKGENSGSRKSGPEKATSGYLFCTTPNELKLHEDFLWNIQELLEKITTRGAHLVGTTHLGAPGPPPVPIFWYIGPFDLEKIRRGLSG